MRHTKKGKGVGGRPSHQEKKQSIQAVRTIKRGITITVKGASLVSGKHA